MVTFYIFSLSLSCYLFLYFCFNSQCDAVWDFVANSTRIKYWWFTWYQHTDNNSIRWISFKSITKYNDWFTDAANEWFIQIARRSNINTISWRYITVLGTLKQIHNTTGGTRCFSSFCFIFLLLYNQISILKYKSSQSVVNEWCQMNDVLSTG